MTPSRRDRYRGALLGLAAGDAVGTTVEFKPPGTFPPVTDMVGGGPFALPAGAWTDDTSMALCLADSLLACRRFDPVDQLSRYVRWFRDGERSSTGSCFDIGVATRTALTRFERTGEPFPGDAAPDAAGNGPLVKLAPVALAFARHPATAREAAALSARTTHGAPQAAHASRWFAGLLLQALDGRSADELLATQPDMPLHPAVQAVTDGSFRTKEPPAIRGSGYVVDALEAALWALRSTSSFEAAVLAAVNLGDDADTTGAIVGQLAGALYGADAIPAAWRSRLVLGGEIVALADGLLELSEDPGLVRGLDGYPTAGHIGNVAAVLTAFVQEWRLPLNPEDTDLMAFAILRHAGREREADDAFHREVLDDVQLLVAEQRAAHERMLEAMRRQSAEKKD